MRVVLTRQVTDSRMRILTPGEHDLPEAEARYYEQKGWTDQPLEPVVEPSSSAAAQPALVEVPADWGRLHALQMRRLASEIAARKVPTKAEATEIIAAEIDRRKGQANAD